MIMGCIEEEDNISQIDLEEDIGEEEIGCFQNVAKTNKYPDEVEDINFDEELTADNTPQTRSDSLEAGNSTHQGCHQQGPQEDNLKPCLKGPSTSIEEEQQLEMLDQMLDFCYI